MKQARLVLSDAAVTDILEQADWYIAQSGPALALLAVELVRPKGFPLVGLQDGLTEYERGHP